MTRRLTPFLVGVLATIALLLPLRFAPNAKIYGPNLLAALGLERIVDASYIPSAIKSVTAISIAYSNNPSVAGTQSVSVTKANSFLYGAGDLVVGEFLECSGWGTITSGTTITVTPRTGDACASHTWKGTLVEFYGNFVKSQGGTSITINAASTSATATITSVNTAKTLTSWTGLAAGIGSVCNDQYTTPAGQESMVVLTSATVITASLAAVSPNACPYKVGYSYLELR